MTSLVVSFAGRVTESEQRRVRWSGEDIMTSRVVRFAGRSTEGEQRAEESQSAS